MKFTPLSKWMPTTLIVAAAAGLPLVAGAALKLPQAQHGAKAATVQPGDLSATGVTIAPNSSNLRLICTPGQCPVGQFCNTETGLCQFFWPCHPLPCPPGSVLENEPSCLLDAEDTFNRGCGLDPPQFSPMTCNTTICGETYFSGNRRDTDWYEIILTVSTRITLILTTDFQGAIVGFAQQIDGIHDWPTTEAACLNLVGYLSPAAVHFDQACGTSISVTECFPPGRIYAFASFILGQTTPSFECHRYNLVVQCPERPCSVACCLPDGTCQELTGPECDRVASNGDPTANSGRRLASETSCADDAATCTIGCASATPIDCNTITSVNNCDVYTQPSEGRPRCLEGDETPPFPTYGCANGNDQTGTQWFSFVATAESVMIGTCNSDPAGEGVPPGGGDSTMALYGGHCNDGIDTTLTEMACSEDSCGPIDVPWQSFICVGGLTPGDTYYIQFSAWDDEARGAYDLEVKCPCPALDVCTATAARSCAQHDCDRLCLDLDVPPDSGGSNVENRITLGSDIEIDFATDTAPTNPNLASVDCTDLGGAVTSHLASVNIVSVAGDTVTVTFNPPLPDQNACVLTLNCGASVCIRILQGDTNRNGTVTTGDFSGVRFWFSQTACVAGANVDYNTANGITTGDASGVRFFFNNTVPACP